jgi:hypothetical protein
MKKTYIPHLHSLILPITLTDQVDDDVDDRQDKRQRGIKSLPSRNGELKG